nr:MAG TPA: hypothetical protein [Caudoviricetes sp.]
MKVYSPNKSYTGVTASVPFCNGQGETDDPYLLEWFEKHGYEVEKPAAPEPEELLEPEEPVAETMEEPVPELVKPAKKAKG